MQAMKCEPNMTYKRPSKRGRTADPSDIFSHLRDGCCVNCLIRPERCDVTYKMLEQNWPKYRHQIVAAWQARGGKEIPWGCREFEGVGE